MAQNETARATVYLDGKQAEAALQALDKRAKDLTNDLKAAMLAGDKIKMDKLKKEIKTIETVQRGVKKESFDVERVLKEINKVSFSDLKKAQATVLAQTNRMTRGTEEYAAKQKDLRRITDELANIRNAGKQTEGMWGKLTSAAKGLLPAFGFAAIAAGAATAFKKIIGATDELSDKWEKMIGGLNAGMTYFWTTLASGNWDKFFSKMKEAIDLGQKYTETLDKIRESQQGLSLEESMMQRRMAELEVTMRRSDLSKDVRIAAGEERLRLEQKFVNERVNIANEELANEFNHNIKLKEISQARFIQIMVDRDSQNRLAAEDYAKKKKAYNEAVAMNVSTFTTTSGATLTTQNKETEAMKQMRLEIEAFPDAIKDYGNALTAFSDMNETERDVIINAFKGVEDAFASGVKNTKKAQTMLANLKAGKDVDATDDEEITGKTTKNAKKLTPRDMSAVAPELMARVDALAVSGNKERELTDIIREEAQKQFDIRAKQLDNELAIQEAREGLRDAQIETFGQIAGAMAYMVEEGSAAQIALLAFEKAIAIAQVWINHAKQLSAIGVTAAQMNTIPPWTAGTIYSAIAIPKATASAIASTALIAAQTVGQIAASSKKGKKDGGYTGSSVSDDTPMGIYHGNEFFVNAKGVRNPTIKPVLDIIDIAQRSGTIQSLNLPALIGGGKQAGGYSSPVISTAPLPGGAGVGLDPEFKSLMKELNETLKKGITAKVAGYGGEGSVADGIKQISNLAKSLNL